MPEPGKSADLWRVACAKQMVLQDAAAAGAREARKASEGIRGTVQYHVRVGAVRRHEHALNVLQQVWQDAHGLEVDIWRDQQAWDDVVEASGIFQESPRKA